MDWMDGLRGHANKMDGSNGWMRKIWMDIKGGFLGWIGHFSLDVFMDLLWIFGWKMVIIGWISRSA